MPSACSRSATVLATRWILCRPRAEIDPDKSLRSSRAAASGSSGAISLSTEEGSSELDLKPLSCASSRAAATRSATRAVGSAGSRHIRSSMPGFDMNTARSNLSSRGPDSRRVYLARRVSEHLQCPSLIHSPHGHGFMAATSWKRDGSVTVPRARHRRMTPSSRGCLNRSSTEAGNSPISSKKSTPQCARLISPGLSHDVPPPTIDTSEAP